MRDNNDRKQTGRVNYVWVLAGGYLLYLAFNLLSGLWKGNAESLLVNLGGGLLFAAVGAGLFLREWRAYQYGKAHMDDPETWSEEDEELPEEVPTQLLEEGVDADTETADGEAGEDQ